MVGTVFLLFKIGDERYALEASRVVAALPLLSCKPVPGTPEAILGIINYHGATVPVVDLQAMLLGTPTEERLSTRLFLIRYHGGDGAAGGPERLLALKVGKAIESIRLTLSDFQPAGAVGARFLGPVITLPRGIVQKIEPEEILSPAVRERLWTSLAAEEMEAANQ